MTILTLRFRNLIDNLRLLHSTCLFDHHIDFVSIFHLKRGRGVRFLDSFTVEDESARVSGESLSLAVGVHELFELGCLFDFEEDFRSVLRFDLDVDMF